jgi:hypothetical protein
MASQLDLDQGGTYRQWERVYLGPSVGWVYTAKRNVLLITAAGTYQLVYGTSLVQVNCAGLVTVTLPSAIDPTVPPSAMPGPYTKTPITIVDIGGNASTYNITINPFSGAENIMGTPSIVVAVDYGGYILFPVSAQMGWSNAQ